jgi:hypothetical protein
VFAGVLAGVLASGGCKQSVDPPMIRAGSLDLTHWDFAANGTVALVGDWELCWDELVDPASGDCPGGWEPFPVPRLWSDSGVSERVRPKGVASYRAVLELPGDAGAYSLRVGAPITAYRLWIDGVERGGSGVVGRSAAETVAHLENRLIPLPAGSSRAELLLHVANFEFRGGGLRRRSYVGLDEQVRARNAYELLLYTTFAVSCVVIGLFFLAQFALHPTDRARGWFALWALLVGLRVLPASTGDLYQLTLGWAPFGVLLRIEYVNTALLIAVGLAYLRDKIPGVMPTRVTKLLLLTALALVPIHCIAGLDTVLATLPVILVLPVLSIALAIASYGRAARRRIPGAAETLAVGAAFAVGIVHDVVRTRTGLGAPIELFPYFVVAFIASEAHSLLRAFARSVSSTEQLSEHLQDSNFELQESEEAMVRFVPFELLRILDKKSIADVGVGDYADVDGAVLCCETGDTTPSTDLAQLGRWVEAIESQVRERGGVVGDLQGDHVVALFPGGAGDAAEVARRLRAAAPDAFRGGIASGAVRLGVVGDHEHFRAVLVGETVDLARELHRRARADGTPLLVCDRTERALRAG